LAGEAYKGRVLYLSFSKGEGAKGRRKKTAFANTCLRKQGK
jgi:hypothetical protein